MNIRKRSIAVDSKRPYSPWQIRSSNARYTQMGIVGNDGGMTLSWPCIAFSIG